MSSNDLSSEDLRYDQMVQDALRSVVQRSLTQVAEKGLPGEHHFYITFKTQHPQVDIPPELSKRYPSEMTIVLQNQFWDLNVAPDRFEVTLSFSSVPHRLKVPFSAVIAFADPSVRFGLQFDVSEGDGVSVSPADTLSEGQAVTSANAAGSEEEGPAEADKEEAAEAGEAKIVTLDSFRKK